MRFAESPTRNQITARSIEPNPPRIPDVMWMRGRYSESSEFRRLGRFRFVSAAAGTATPEACRGGAGACEPGSGSRRAKAVGADETSESGASASIRYASSSSDSASVVYARSTCSASGTVKATPHAGHFVRFPANVSATENCFPQSQPNAMGICVPVPEVDRVLDTRRFHSTETLLERKMNRGRPSPVEFPRCILTGECRPDIAYD